jgi:hypothetical protein
MENFSNNPTDYLNPEINYYLLNKNKETKLNKEIYAISLEKYRELDGVKDGFEQELEKFSKWLVPISEASPLKESKLVVFDDNFTGMLPLNGITQTDFKKWEIIYEQIINNQTPIRFEKDDPDFQKSLHQAFLMIISRPMGRREIEKIIFQSSSDPERLKIVIKKTETEQTEAFPLTLDQGFILCINNQPHRIPTQLPTGEKILVEIPFFSVLFHELIHISHFQQNLDANLNEKPTLQLNFSNLEEQITITGLAHPISPSVLNVIDEEDWSPIEQADYMMKLMKIILIQVLG